MPGTSKSTTSVACRVRNEDYEKLRKRADRRGLKVSEFLRERITKDILRNRHKQIESPASCKEAGD